MTGKAGIVLGALLVATASACGSAIRSSNGQRIESPASTPSCGHHGPSFELSLATSARGQSSPERAAAAFARNDPPVAEPLTGWHVVSRATDVAQLQSGSFRLEAIRVPNGTWLVDGGGCV
jgi:hypothetical protein